MGEPKSLRLDGGHDHGARLQAGTVWRRAASWTPAVHDLLSHLADRGFTRAPRPLSIENEIEQVTYLEGQTVGHAMPWPPWTHSETALVQVARWLRDYHCAVADYRSPVDAPWREQHAALGPDVLIAHNDAAPYNAVWHDADALVGFIDWDMAGPRHRDDDLAWTAFSWVPLHARRVVEAEGFTAFDLRRDRLDQFLTSYGSALTAADIVSRLQTVIGEHVLLIRQRAEYDETYQRMLDMGRDTDLRTAQEQLTQLLTD